MPAKSSSLLIAPWFEIASLRDWVKQSEAAAILNRYGLTLDLLLQNFLHSLQPHPVADIRLGYTVAINVYDLFSQDADSQWHFDIARMEFFTDLFRKVERPVVVNLRANHFVGEGPLVAELMAHESSYARLNDDSPVKDIYYSNPVFGPTFALDESIPLNRFRFEGFRRAASMLAQFDRRHPGIIHAVTLGGELHHFLPELANPKAAGQFAGARMTDYSPHSIRDFAAWLKTRYSSVGQLNKSVGTSFRSWEEIEPPRWDLEIRHDAPQWSHMDSYANGQLPVFGWVMPPVKGSLTVYLDAKPLGQAEYGLSRLDVYDAVPSLAESDVGFRFDIDYRKLSPGRHILHVVMEKEHGGRFLVGVRGFYIAGNAKDNLRGIYFGNLDNLPEGIENGEKYAWLDHPPNDLLLRFNPYAAEWQVFRGTSGGGAAGENSPGLPCKPEFLPTENSTDRTADRAPSLKAVGIGSRSPCRRDSPSTACSVQGWTCMAARRCIAVCVSSCRGHVTACRNCIRVWGNLAAGRFSRVPCSITMIWARVSFALISWRCANRRA